MITNFNDFLNEDAILLRTMTLKSKLGFGKYINETVQKIIELHKIDYLRELYYKYEKITFTDEVLRLIGILSDKFDYRIEKPGTNPELYIKIFKNYSSEYIPKNIKKIDLKLTSLSRMKKFHSNKVRFSKSVMQAKNQGKK
jgi:hypothetical protein